MKHSLDFAFGLLGNVVSFMVFLAPLPTFYEIYKRKSTQGFQSVPYVIGLFSALLWIYYALLKTDTTLLITINSVGCLIQSTYICLYLFYAPKSARMQTVMLLLLLNGIGMGLIVLITHFLPKASARTTFVGWICLVFSLCVFIAPLCVVRRVIRTKSVEYMPFLLSFFLTLSAVMWFFYGLLRKDYNIAIPNVLGFTFGVIQMVLYLVYRRAGKVEEQKLGDAVTIVQLVESSDNNNNNNKKSTCPGDDQLKEQIIDVVSLSAVVACPEIIPVEILDQEVKITILESDQKAQSS